MIGITMFQSAYTAEAVRGGLAAIPRGQTEAAMALGLRILEADSVYHFAAGIKNFDSVDR